VTEIVLADMVVGRGKAALVEGALARALEADEDHEFPLVHGASFPQAHSGGAGARGQGASGAPGGPSRTSLPMTGRPGVPMLPKRRNGSEERRWTRNSAACDRPGCWA